MTDGCSHLFLEIVFPKIKKKKKKKKLIVPVNLSRQKLLTIKKNFILYSNLIRKIKCPRLFRES